MTAKQEAEAILAPLERWAHGCHEASLKLVHDLGRSDVRVARGGCVGVPGQHSWVVVGDPYHPTLVIDPTLWSYRADVEGVFVGSPDDFKHIPHGAGSIWAWGRPNNAVEPPLEFDRNGLSREACDFLDLIEPLDLMGWGFLFSHAPVEGWPAGEIVEQAYGDERLRPYIPIDRVGMLTDLNPDGLYLP